MGAVVTTPEIAQVLSGRSYFNTFGGNPVCCAAGGAVLRVIHKEKLQQNAFTVGTYLKNRLIRLHHKYQCKFISPFPCKLILLFRFQNGKLNSVMGDVRGRGLMLGVELVTDRELKTPAKAETLHIMDQMKGKT